MELCSAPSMPRRFASTAPRLRAFTASARSSPIGRLGAGRERVCARARVLVDAYTVSQDTEVAAHGMARRDLRVRAAGNACGRWVACSASTSLIVMWQSPAAAIWTEGPKGQTTKSGATHHILQFHRRFGDALIGDAFPKVTTDLGASTNICKEERSKGRHHQEMTPSRGGLSPDIQPRNS